MLNRKRIQYRPEVGLVKEYSVPTFLCQIFCGFSAPVVKCTSCICLQMFVTRSAVSWVSWICSILLKYKSLFGFTPNLVVGVPTPNLRWGVTPFRIYVGQRLSGKLPKSAKSPHTEQLRCFTTAAMGRIGPFCLCACMYWCGAPMALY